VATLAFVVLRRELRSETLTESTTPPPISFIPDWKAATEVAKWDGRPDSQIQILEFADLQCPACREASATVQKIQKRFGRKVSLGFVHFPLTTIHPFARPAARAAECADRHGAFHAFANAVYARQGALGERSWSTFAGDAGIRDTQAFVKCLRDPASLSAVERAVGVGSQLGVHSTPTFLVNGWRVSGAVSEADFAAIIDSLLADRSPPGATLALSNAPNFASDSVRVVRAGDSIEQLAEYTLSREPILETSADDPADFDLTYVRQGLPLSDGRLVTYSPVGARLLLFDSFGRGQKLLARSGSGPGDIAKASNAMLVGRDTIAVVDIGSHRLSLFHPDRGTLSSTAVNGELRAGTKIAGVLPDGRVVVHTAGTRQPGTTAATGSSKATVSIIKNGEIRDLLSFADLRLFEFEMKFGNKIAREVDVVRLSGSAQVAVWDSLIAVVPTDKRVVELYNPTGRLVSRVELPGRRQQVSRQMRETSIAQQLESLRGPHPERPVNLPELERLARQGEFADSLASSEAIFSSAAGELWIVDAIAPGAKGWSALSLRRDGSISKRLVTTVDGIPVGINGNRVAIRVRDSDDVAHIRIFQIVQSQARKKE